MPFLMHFVPVIQQLHWVQAIVLPAAGYCECEHVGHIRLQHQLPVCQVMRFGHVPHHNSLEQCHIRYLQILYSGHRKLPTVLRL